MNEFNDELTYKYKMSLFFKEWPCFKNICIWVLVYLLKLNYNLQDLEMYYNAINIFFYYNCYDKILNQHNYLYTYKYMTSIFWFNIIFIYLCKN